jgi:hypothetical protein
MVPLLELQRRQQIATLYFFSKGPSLLKCSIVAPEAHIARGDCFIKIRQYTQVLSLARISRSSCSEIPYVLGMDGWHTLALISILTNEDGRMIPLQYVNAEELVSLFRRC